MNAQPRDYFPELMTQVSKLKGPPAWQLLEQAALEHPQDPRPLTMLGASLMAEQQVDVAEAAYISAIQRAPDFAVARFQLGLLRLTSGRPAAALATWQPLETLGETHPLCLFKRGLSALARDRYEEARSCLAAGIAANTTNPPLNRDMQGFIDRMIAQGVVPRDDAPADGDRPRAAAHFLVSEYGRKA